MRTRAGAGGDEMKSSILLRKAREHIRDRKFSHLCCAIVCAAQEVGTGEAAKKAEKLRERIMLAIYPRVSASMWLYNVLNPEQDFVDWRTLHVEDLHEWRLHWLHALITEYEAKGD